MSCSDETVLVIVHGGSPKGKVSLHWEGFLKEVGFKLAVKECGTYK